MSQGSAIDKTAVVIQQSTDVLAAKLDQVVNAIAVSQEVALANLAAADPSQFVPSEMPDFLMGV